MQQTLSKTAKPNNPFTPKSGLDQFYMGIDFTHKYLQEANSVWPIAGEM